MKEFFKSPLPYILLVAILFIIGIRVSAKNNPVKISCDDEYKMAQKKWEDSGETCVMSAIELTCHRDRNNTATVNPCVGRLLQSKGWK